ncbi:GntR family transcriptional regulator [Novipirellula caenicola]|uniref:GntR family transcriptional regulator n=1 Tax=Novipirellula caenicola TaxID=1536901 RepID=UPI0031F04C5A
MSYDYIGSIRDRLTSGEVSPRKQLVNRTLAGKFGKSVIPVRMANPRLTNEGLVDRIHAAGAYVRNEDRQDLNNL